MPTSSRSPARIALIVFGVLIALTLLAQVLVPRIVEGEIESRLTASGGEAKVELQARPVVSLLFNDGDELSIEAREVELADQNTDRAEALRRLDGFDRVSIEIAESTAGPMAIQDFALIRGAPEAPYEIRLSGTTSGSELADYGAEQLGFDSPLIGGIASALGAGQDEIPVELALQVISRDGRLAVRDGDATIAGVPTGPLVELILAAVVARI